jgi:Spy/CpxP family protein refolding chaperone
MKKILTIVVILLTALTVKAETPQQFSPEKFQADLEQFITNEANLTPEESKKFFPLYREMQQKQRVVFKQMKDLGVNKPADEAACKKALEKRDELELEQKRIQQNYHKQFLNVLPASKVYDVIKAENHFHRTAFRKWRHQK